MQALLVLTTVGTHEQAELIARELIDRRLAACVNVLPEMGSIYRWEGRICSEKEILLLVKTLENALPEVERAIKELHSYELPEILAFPVTWGEARFLEWIEHCLDKRATPAENGETVGSTTSE